MKYLIILFIFLLSGCSSTTSTSNKIEKKITDVYFAGISFTGNYKDNKTNYPYSYNIIQKFPLDSVFVKKLNDNFKNETLRLKTSFSDEDSAIGLTLAIDLENISISKISKNKYKLIIDIYSQILAFDFDEKKIINTYPVNIQYISLFNKSPTNKEINSLIEGLYLGNNSNIKTNIIDLAVDRINKLEIKPSYGHRLKINKIEINEKAKIALKSKLSDDNFNTLTAQSFTKSLVDHQHVSILPYTKGQAIGGKMTARFSNGNIYNFEIPEADYLINVTVKDFKTLVQKEINTKMQSFFAFTNIEVIQHDLNKVYMNIPIRNQEIAILLNEQIADEKNSYVETLMNLFEKLSKNISNTNSEWLENSIAPNLHSKAKSDLKSFSEIIKKCR